MASQRITIRLSPALAAKLAAKVGAHGTLADTVRHAIELYLEEQPGTRQPRQPPVADAADTSAASSADMAATLAATVADIHVRLAAVEQRLTTLQSQPSPGSQRRPDWQPTAAKPAATQAPPYDPTKYTLGRLCPRGHDYQGTGQSLRRRHNGECAQCNIDQQRERRQRQREQREGGQ